jgi:hypothetical protein
MLLRIFGVVLIVAGFGLAAISGYLAYFGFEHTIKLPFIGMIGPFVALSLASLGVAVEVAFRRRKWLAFVPLFALMVVAGLIDKNGGEIALKNIVNDATQGDSDRNTAYSTALSTKADLEKQIADLEAEYKVMTGSDIAAAQEVLLARGLYVDAAGNPMPIDGKRGPFTLKAMADRGKAITAELGNVRSDLKSATATVASGAAVTEAPFTLHQAELYALMITVMSVLFAMAGSFVYGGFGDDEPNIDEEIEQVEEIASKMENNIVRLAEHFGAFEFDDEPAAKRKRG